MGTRNLRKKPVSLAWRPDGQGSFLIVYSTAFTIHILVLTVIFASRTLVLVSVQDGHLLSSETLPFEIRSSNWIERKIGQSDENIHIEFESISIKDYLPALVDLPSINRSRKYVIDPPDDLFTLEKQTKLNV